MSKLSQFFGGGGGGSGGLPTVIANEDMAAEVNIAYGVNTHSGEVSITMPLSPDVGDRVSFFDVAVSWRKHPATIILNGDPVQFYDGESDRFKLIGDSASLSLIYLGADGWADTSYQDRGVIPLWYESIPGTDGMLVDVDEFMKGKEWVEKLNATTSQTYSAEEGWYIISVCGSGGSDGSRAGNDSLVRLNSAELIKSFRGYGARQSGKSIVAGVGSGNPRFEAEVSAGFVNSYSQGGAFIVSKGSNGGSLLVEGLNDGGLFGFGVTYSRGVIGGSAMGTAANVGGITYASSILVYLKDGDELEVEVGSGLTYSGGASSYRHGDPGRVTIRRLEDIGI